jgi:G6PDH family F420-dependent oxidoreductase
VGGVAEVKVGYAAALEQFSPGEIVELSTAAEGHGFTGVMAADHFQPWVPQQGQASYVWSVLGALGQRTRGDLGPGVACPSFRHHPAIVAQAAATLESMYPGRTWLGLGSGEALNEHVFGGYWPEAPERIRMMFEAVEVIQKLFTGKDVKHAGEFFKLHSTRLWTMPKTPPQILIATAGPITAKRAGARCDGIITPGATVEKVAGVLAKFDEGATSEGKDGDAMPKLLQLHLSWADTDEEALANAITEWPNGGMKFPKQDVRSPHDFAAMAALVRPDDFNGRMVISSDPDAHRAEIQRFLDVGVTQVYLHNVGRNQREWMDVFGAEVLPKLHR